MTSAPNIAKAIAIDKDGNETLVHVTYPPSGDYLYAVRRRIDPNAEPVQDKTHTSFRRFVLSNFRYPDVRWRKEVPGLAGYELEPAYVYLELDDRPLVHAKARS